MGADFPVGTHRLLCHIHQSRIDVLFGKFVILFNRLNKIVPFLFKTLNKIAPVLFNLLNRNAIVADCLPAWHRSRKALR